MKTPRNWSRSALATGVTAGAITLALVAGTASAAPKSPKPQHAACALIPAKDVRSVFHAAGSLKVKDLGFADAPSTVGGTKLGWDYNCTASAIPNPNMSEETVALTWFPGATRSVVTTVAGSAYGLNTGHDPIKALSGVGQAAEYFGNNIVAYAKGDVIALTVTLPTGIGQTAPTAPVATLKKTALAVIGHLP